jgi:hypothetical protein
MIEIIIFVFLVVLSLAIYLSAKADRANDASLYEAYLRVEDDLED